MNKLDVNPPALRLSPASLPQPQPVHRLIVLVSSSEVDLPSVTHRVWELANGTGVHIQFLGLYSDPLEESSLRRDLVTMSAMVKDDKVSAEAEVIFGKNWVDVLKTRTQTGDMVVCFAEQRTGLLQKPLSQVLQSDLNISIYVLSGLYPRDVSRSNWLAQIAVWAGSLAIIIGFFMFQIKVDHLAKDWTHTLLLLLSIPIEVLVIWAWNGLFE